jgi:uncharacterized protein YheU (UPF0270 family)
MITVPWQSLEVETLDSLLEEIVTRDGTDYGIAEKSTTEKLTRARNQLRSGFAVLVWNPESESASLVSREEAAAMGLDPANQRDTGFPD